MVEPRTPEREVGGSIPPTCCVLEQRHIYSLKGAGKEALAPS